MNMVKTLDIPIYNTSVCFMIGGGKEELDELRQDNPDKIDEIVYRQLLEDIQDNNKCDGLTSRVVDGTYFVFIRQGLVFDPRIVFHELFHLTNYILCDRGVEHNETAESWAYLIGWIAEEYYKMVNEEHRTIKE